ncbi:MAG: phosphatase PAP2 family protein [Ignavibacteriae bacterium]|nr:phosphatase PAP2 family protein [Ignavibacteriota bacterium]
MRITKLLMLITAINLPFSSIYLCQNKIGIADSVCEISNDIELVANNNIEYFSRPLMFSANDWLVLSGITVGTGILISIDKEVQNKVRTNQSNFLDDFTLAGKYYGDVYGLIGIPLFVYGSGLIFENEELRTTGRILTESLIAAGITTTVLKVIIGRSRPKKNKGEFDFNFIEFKNINVSLPSGHSTVAFTISTVLSERIDNIYASIGLYGLASLTAFQRIYSNNHWLSDTILGATIGITAGKFFSNLENERKENSKEKISFRVLPYLNSSAMGLSLQIQF